MQLTHSTSKFKKHKFPIVLICDNIYNAPNIGSVFRIADAFGVEELVFCGKDIPIGRRMTKTSRSTEKYVNYRTEVDTEIALSSLKKTHRLIALEITEKSKSLSALKLTSKEPIALVIGNENYGIALPVLKLCDTIIHIDMFGHNSSMNVVQAASIALFEITRQLKD